MAIRGRGKDPQEGLAAGLRKMEAELKLLAEIATGKGDKALAEQLEILTPYTHNPSKQTQDAARTLALKLYVDGLESQDPHARAEFEKIIASNPRLKELFGAKANEANGGITDRQLGFFLNLTGVLSDAERNALTLIEPLITAQQETTIVEPVRAETHKARRALASLMSRETRGVLGSTVLPTLIPVVTSSALVALDLIAPGAGSALAMGGTAVGYDVGTFLQKEAYGADSSFGNNRAAGTEVDRELVRAYDQAVQPIERESEPKDLARALKQRAEVIEDLLGLRQAPAAGELYESEKKGEAALKAFANALSRAAKSRDPLTGFELAQTQLKESVRREQLAESPSRVPGPSPIASEQQLQASLEVMIRSHIWSMLALSNEPLTQVLAVINHKYGIDAPPDAPAPIETKLTKSEIQSIRALMRAEPSLAEFATVLRLVQLEKASFADLFEGIAQVNLPEGGKMSVAEMLKVMDAMGGRGDADTLATVGKQLPRVILYLTAIGGGALALTNPLGWIGLLGMVGTMVITRLTGRKVGLYLQEQAAQKKVMSGIEAGHVPMNAHNFLLERIGTMTKILEGSATTVKKRLLDEAGIIDTLVQAQLACAPNPALAAFDVLSNIRGKLLDLSKSFKEIAQGDLPLPKIRSKVMAAQAQLFGPEVAYDTVFDLVRSQTISEQPKILTIQGHLMKLLLKGITDLVERADASGAVPTNFTLVRLSRQIAEIKDALPKDQAKTFEGIGGLTELAKHVLKHPHQPADLDQLRAISRDSAKIQAELNERFVAVAAIGEDRVKEVTQDLYNVIWTQAYPLFGSVDDLHREKIPKIHRLTVATEPQEDGLVMYKVSGELPDGGTIKVEMDAFGAPSVQSLQIHQSERTLAELATGALARALAPFEIDVPFASAKLAQISEGFPGFDAEKLGASHLYRVEIPVGKEAYAIAVTQDGFPLFESVTRVTDRASA